MEMAGIPEVAQYVAGYEVNTLNYLGHGAFGFVHRAIHPDHPGVIFAAKKIPGLRFRHGIQELNRPGTIELENCEKLQRLGRSHENILEIFDVVWPNHIVGITDMYIFTEFCEYGDLNAFVRNDLQGLASIPSGHMLIKCDLMCQVSSGLEYLHENDIVHRDIKPGNILIQKIHDNQPHVKIGDYGLSKFLEAGDTSLMQTNVGTSAFKSPQHWETTDEGEIRYHRKADIFSCGVTFYALINATANLLVAFDGPSIRPSEQNTPIGQLMFERRKYNQPVPKPVRYDQNDSINVKILKKVIEQTLEYEEDRRITASQMHRKLKDVKDHIAYEVRHIE